MQTVERFGIHIGIQEMLLVAGSILFESNLPHVTLPGCHETLIWMPERKNWSRSDFRKWLLERRFWVNQNFETHRPAASTLAA